MAVYTDDSTALAWMGKSVLVVIPAKAGIQGRCRFKLTSLDPDFAGTAVATDLRVRTAGLSGYQGEVKMARFIINRNAQTNGDHEVHNLTTGCQWMPAPENRTDLGDHLTCHGAVVAAKAKWPGNRINGCRTCCNPCHTT